jgi:large subunit ribosomal protein L19
MDALLDSISADKRKEHPEFGAGDTVRVHQRVIEGEKERIQIFEGVCMRRQGNGMSATFTVRKISSGGIGVERIYPLYSPRIAKIDCLRRGKVRRANISYLRELRGRAARISEKR